MDRQRLAGPADHAVDQRAMALVGDGGVQDAVQAFVVVDHVFVHAGVFEGVEELQGVADDGLKFVDDALAANSRFEQGPVIWTKGDPEAALSRAPHVVEGSFEVGGQEHFYLEGQVAACLPQEGGDVVIHSSTQHPTEIQHKVAHALHLPMSAVRVEVRRMGGGCRSMG